MKSSAGYSAGEETAGRLGSSIHQLSDGGHGQPKVGAGFGKREQKRIYGPS